VHPKIIGNKWRKLKYNLLEAKQLGHKTLVTFGGAYSNHIHAVASAGNIYGFETIGIIRGDELNENSNDTLKYASNNGMDLIFVDRKAYENKLEMAQKFGKNAFYIPEGGTNELAYQGLAELREEISHQIKATHICVAMGTGGTFGGLLLANSDNSQLIGTSVLKGYATLFDFLPDFPKLKAQNNNYCIWTDYHFGGYGKYNQELLEFIKAFENEHNIPIEQTYTGKLIYSVFDKIKNDFFPENSIILIIHTGGLQGKLH
jgi:1-aminocyclopropane-1-carboxylate deaminase